MRFFRSGSEGSDRIVGLVLAASAFALGVTPFDLANTYGPPYGSAERNFGRILREDWRRIATS